MKRADDEKERKAWEAKVCRHPEHNTPGHMVFPPGTYVHKCPGCGEERRVRIPRIECMVCPKGD